VNAAFANDKAYLDTLKQWRATLLRATRTMLVWDGKMGTNAEVELARSYDCLIIPVPGAPDGLATRLLADDAIREKLRSIDPDYLDAALKGPPTARQIVKCVTKSLR
jgi:hypothetical protein